MDTLFLNSKNSKTYDPHRLLLNLSEKKALKRGDKYVALLNLSIYNTSKNMKKSNKHDRFKTLALKWNEKLKLPGGSYSVSDIQVNLSISSKNMTK